MPFYVIVKIMSASSASITLQHAIYQIPERTPVVFPTTFLQPKLIDEKHVMLETGVQMRFQSQVHDYRIMMAVDMCIHSIQAFEHGFDDGGE